jgi:hypothetical protein
MSQGLYNNETVTTLGDDTVHVVTIDKVLVNVFFDGTLNNYYNVKKADPQAKARYDGEGSSYQNALSNVARMWDPVSKELMGPDFGLYIEGIGTQHNQADSLSGYAFGMGETGIEARARSVFAPLRGMVEKKRGKQDLPALLELNVFGFSRGAATARHFVHLLRNSGEIANHFPGRWQEVLVQVNFVGLFDTISAEGVYYGNDVSDLQLKFSDEAALRVFQLIALDEYRENFAVTTIASARLAKTSVFGIRVPMGFELGIPGSHSDVGGGYPCDFSTVELETRRLPNSWRGPVTDSEGLPTANRPQDTVYEQGWYSPEDRHKGDWHRREVTGDYFKVALSLMVDQAEKHTVSRYMPEADLLARDPVIAEVQAKLRKLLASEAFVPGKPTRVDWDLDEQLGTTAARAFRRQYLHLSFDLDKTGMAPRYNHQNQLQRHHEPG